MRERTEGEDRKLLNKTECWSTEQRGDTDEHKSIRKVKTGQEKEQLRCRAVQACQRSASAIAALCSEPRPGWHSAVRPLLCANPSASRHNSNITPLTAAVQPALWKTEECKERQRGRQVQISESRKSSSGFTGSCTRKKNKRLFLLSEMESN